MRGNKIYAKLSKCDFNSPEVEFLGHIVGREGIKVDPAKIAVVRDWPLLQSTSEIRQFLRLANYFRKFIQGYSSLAAPLTILLAGKDKAVMLNNNNNNRRLVTLVMLNALQIDTFEAIIHALTNAPVLIPPDLSKPFEVVSDASLLGTGAVLLQDGKPIAYSSSKFIPAERNFTTGEQELLGVFKTLKEWRWKVVNALW